MTLNPGVVNFTWEKTGGIGVSNSTTGNMFSVAGNRPQQNLFLLNGVEFTGAAENNMQPGGASEQTIWAWTRSANSTWCRIPTARNTENIPAARFRSSRNPEPISGTGPLYEYLRNNALDAPNYFDVAGAPPFQRNQFGGFRSAARSKKTRHSSSPTTKASGRTCTRRRVELVPDANARAQANAAVQGLGLLNLWPVAPAGVSRFSGRHGEWRPGRNRGGFPAAPCRRFAKISEPRASITCFPRKIR